MDLFGQAKKALGSLAGEVQQQADYVKLQTRLGSLQGDLDRELQEAGARARVLWGMGQIKDQELDLLMERVRKLEQDMEAVRAEIQAHGQGATGRTRDPGPGT